MSVKNDSYQHTVTVTNHDQTIYGFFFSLYLPSGNGVATTDIKVGGLYRSDYVFEVEPPGVIYPDCTTYRWVLSEPTEFDGISLITGQTAVITFTTEQPLLNSQYSFVGWIAARREGFFGYN